MFPKPKSALNLNPWYVGVYLFVLGLLAFSSYMEYRSRYRDVLQLIQDQAAVTAAVIARSGSNQAMLTEELKQSYIDRALDMLYLLNEIDRDRPLTQDDLDAWVNDETILEITTYDEKGKRVGGLKTSARESVNESPEQKTWLQGQVEGIVNASTDLIITGVDHSLNDADTLDEPQHFLVIIPRDRGGAIACQLSLEAEEDFKYLTTMDIALEDLIHVKGLEYLQLSLDDFEPYSVSRSETNVDETWRREALDDILFMVSKGELVFLEVVRPVLFNSSLGEVRIGFKADALFSIRGQIIYQLLIRTILLTLLAFVILIFLLVRQNAAVLREEKSRIEAEVYRLEKLNRQREKQAAVGELAAGVAHEIRNPLNAIGIVAQRLKREFITTADQTEFQSLTATMVSEISRINTSLEEFLEYTRPTPLKFSSLNMKAVLEGLLQLYGSEAQEKKISLIVESPDILFDGDAEYLRQGLSNLVRNALDASQKGGTIRLNAQLRDNRVVIIVSDNGAGIAPDQLARVFDLYYTTKDMGTGVGLALTHKIIADHNGIIEVSSELGQGSTFKIELPVKQ